MTSLFVLSLATAFVLLNVSKSFGNTAEDLLGTLRNPDVTPEKIRELLNQGADIRARDNRDNAPLHRVLVADEWNKRRTEIVKILVDAGADVNAKNNEKTPVLFFAARYADAETVRTLIQHGADVNARSQGRTVLFAAILNKDSEVLPALIEAGADVNAKDDYQHSVLCAAIEAKAAPNFANNLEILQKAGAVK